MTVKDLLSTLEWEDTEHYDVHNEDIMVSSSVEVRPDDWDDLIRDIKILMENEMFLFYELATKHKKGFTLTPKILDEKM